MTSGNEAKSWFAWTRLPLIACWLMPAMVLAEETMEPSLRGHDRVLSLPYGFWNETFGATVAYVHAINGFPQPQAGILASIMAGSSGSLMGFFMGQNIKPFRSDRLFFDPIVSIGYFKNTDAYVDGNPDFPGQRAGSHDSDVDNFITGEGGDSYYRLRFNYLLPIGSGRDRILPAYQLNEGMLTGGASGAAAGNPLTSGRTYLELRPFYRTQNIENDDLDAKQSTNGAEFSVFWDNRDYPVNPSRGNALSMKVARDWGLAGSSASWTSFTAEYDHYFDLGEIKGFRQSVVAIDVWTAYSPTWNVGPDGRIAHRPPAFSGATLGGLQRLRAYPSQRFSDKSALHYTAELRMVPQWNFLDRSQFLEERIGIDWIQLVAFADIGRVAPHYEVGTLHEDMHWDAGFGLRAWAKGMIGRIDLAYSEEGVGVQMMIGQPFQF